MYCISSTEQWEVINSITIEAALSNANSQSMTGAWGLKSCFCQGSRLLISTEPRAAWRPGLPRSTVSDESPDTIRSKMVSQRSL